MNMMMLNKKSAHISQRTYQETLDELTKLYTKQKFKSLSQVIDIALMKGVIEMKNEIEKTGKVTIPDKL